MPILAGDCAPTLLYMRCIAAKMRPSPGNSTHCALASSRARRASGFCTPTVGIKLGQDHAPTAVDIEDVFARTQNRTTFITCTKRGAAIINDHTVQVLFRNRRQRLLAQVPGDYEDNQDNHGEGGKLCTDRAPVPAQVPLYRGLRIVLTKNLDKEHRFVNGMGAVVEAVDLETASVLVRTDTGFLLTVYKYTDTEVPVDRVVYFPLRLGYAGTVYKYQGAELDHVTLWLDRPGCPGAAYVALSRVKYDSDYLLGGIVTVKDVVPAR